MIQDNFEKIKRYLTFNSSDDFYFIQIIQRSKDNPQLGANNKVIKTYSINSIESFNAKEKEIKLLCETFNARAYIHLTKRSYKDVALEMLSNLVNRIRCNQQEEIYRCFNTACGTTYQKEDKTWIIDIDEKLDDNSILDILSFVENKCEPIGPKFKLAVSTVRGYHLIVTPFNVETFKLKYPNIDIHKNNPTLLYF